MSEKDMHVRLPRLLQKALNADGQTLKEKARFHPIKMTPTLNMIPLSTATMVIPEDDPDVAMHDFIELYNQHGSIGIFRVISVRTNYRQQREIEMNHAFDLLSDAIYPGSPAGDEGFEGTVAGYLTELIGAQTQKLNGTAYWQLGTCADTSYWSKKIAYDNVLEGFMDVAKDHEDYWFTFDFTTFPWTVNFVRRNSTIVSEFRLRRNIESCQVTLDDSSLCTRLYLSVTTKTTVTESGQTAGEKTSSTYYTYNDDSAQSTYGIVCKAAGIDKWEVPDVSAWVDAYFERHSQPSVQIQIEGEDLKELTGESIDEMHLGRICRTALPAYDDVFLERIVSVTYPDALRMPTRVTVALANKRQKAEDGIASVTKEAKSASSSAKSAGRAGSNNKTDETAQEIRYNLKVEQDNRHFAILATEEQWNEAAQQYDLTHETKFYQDARKFSLIATENEYAAAESGGTTLVNTLQSSITQTATEIRTEVSNTAAGLSSRITQNADNITLEVTNRQDADDALSASVALKADSATVTARFVDIESDITTINSSLTTLTGALTVGNTLTVDRGITAYGGISAAGESGMSAHHATFTNLTATGTVTLGATTATSLAATSLSVGGDSVSKTTLSVVTEFTQALGQTAPTTNVTVLTTYASSVTPWTVPAGTTITFSVE